MSQARRPEMIDLDFPRCIEREYPAEFPLAWRVIERGLDLARQFDPAKLERNHPALRSFNWEIYLRCSVVRMVRVASRLLGSGCTSGRVLEYGSWFGNFGMMLAEQGFEVDVIDSYRAYSPAFDAATEMLTEAGVSVLDFEDHGYGLNGIDDATYDAALCLGVIEHIPHTPRPTLESINRVIKPGGLLILDTPNLAYIYNREKLSRGESIFPAVWHQYFSQMPFHGHHREYTVEEIEWILTQLGHERLFTDLFNYSLYSVTKSVTGEALDKYLIMESDPSAREYIMTVSRKTDRSAGERLHGVPAVEAFEPFSATDAVDLPNEIRKLHEFLSREQQRVGELLTEVGKRDFELRRRDELLQGVQKQVQDLLQETGKRDRMLQVLQAQLDATLEKANSGFIGRVLGGRLVSRMLRQLRDSVREIQRRDRDIKERDRLLQEVQRQVQESLLEIGKREEEIQKRDNLLQEVQRQMDNLMLRTQARDREVQKRDLLLQEVQRQVQDSLLEIAKRDAEIQKRDDMLQELQRQVQDSLAEIGKREAEIAKRDNMLQELQRQVDGLALQMRAREQEIDEPSQPGQDGPESQDSARD